MRTTAKCERCLLASSEAVTACSDLQSSIYCTKVTFTLGQGRAAGSQLLLLPGNPAFMRPRREGFEGCWLFSEVDSGTCFLYCWGACNFPHKDLWELHSICFTCILSSVSWMKAHGKGRKSPYFKLRQLMSIPIRIICTQSHYSNFALQTGITKIPWHFPNSFFVT